MRKAESAAAPSSTELTEAVAKNLFKLMAYKDEYEVARLYTDGSFAKKLSDKFDGDFQLKFYLAPPIFAKRDKSGRLMKKEYGGWMLGAFGWLAKLKFLRGTAFDPFGRTGERKTERTLVEDYFAMIDQRIGWAEAGADSRCWRSSRAFPRRSAATATSRKRTSGRPRPRKRGWKPISKTAGSRRRRSNASLLPLWEKVARSAG